LYSFTINAKNFFTKSLKGLLVEVGTQLLLLLLVRTVCSQLAKFDSPTWVIRPTVCRFSDCF